MCSKDVYGFVEVVFTEDSGTVVFQRARAQRILLNPAKLPLSGILEQMFFLLNPAKLPLSGILGDVLEELLHYIQTLVGKICRQPPQRLLKGGELVGNAHPWPEPVIAHGWFR